LKFISTEAIETIFQFFITSYQALYHPTIFQFQSSFQFCIQSVLSFTVNHTFAPPEIGKAIPSSPKAQVAPIHHSIVSIPSFPNLFLKLAILSAKSKYGVHAIVVFSVFVSDKVFHR
jgi:hypothetical protein